MQHPPRSQSQQGHFPILSGVLPDYDHSHEVTQLESMVTQELQRLNAAYTKMRQVERELQAFLDAYYGEVGPFFEQLEQLNGEIASYERQIRQASRKRARVLANAEEPAVDPRLEEALPSVPADLKGEEIEEEIKAVYRKLAALYHPDAAADKSYSGKIIRLLNQAYSKKNLWAIREMEHSLMEHACKQDAPEQKLARLRERLDAVFESVTRVTDRRKRLECSDAWQMKQRIEQDRYLVEVVIHRVKHQLAEARERLIRKKIEFKAVMSH